jgi:type IV secretion system protein VirB2
MADPLSAPIGPSALVDGAYWIQGTLLGTLATVLAVIAVAWIGFGMLSGRINLQRGAVVILGCFIVFGAPMISRGLMNAAGTAEQSQWAPMIEPAPPPPATPSPAPYDPYAGASVPVR